MSLAVPPPTPERARPAVWRGLSVTALLTLIAIAFTWPLAAHLASRSVWHIDPPFSVWRLAWVAHQLFVDPVHLFNGNIFHPEPRTFAYSDAMLLLGLIATPLIKIGVPPLAVMNLMLIGGLVASGGGMYLLARRLTGDTAAAILAAVIFAFAPYRADHLMHLELQWAPWIPLTLWAFHRTLSDGRLRDGVLTGVSLLCQLLSSIYYALFLAAALAIVGGLSLIRWRARVTRSMIAGFAIGALIVIVVAVPYSRPYRANVQDLGMRPPGEILRYSATPASFLSVTPEHVLYGRWSGSWRETETRLFPGVVALLLMTLAFVAPFGPKLSRGAGAASASVGASSTPGPRTLRWLYLALLVFAVEAALGLNGRLYPLLHDWLTPFKGLRAPGRFGILILLAIGVLAAFGAATLLRATTTAWRRPLAILLCGAMLIEYQIGPWYMEALPTQAPPVYQWLARAPRGTVTIEFPVPQPDGVPYVDPFYMYFSTMHWQPLVNGYSGHYPHSYMTLLEQLRTFPDEPSMAALRAHGVRAIIVHDALFEKPSDYGRIVGGLDGRPGVNLVGTFKDHRGQARTYMLDR